jgi:hypothetical protein
MELTNKSETMTDVAKLVSGLAFDAELRDKLREKAAEVLASDKRLEQIHKPCVQKDVTERTLRQGLQMTHFFRTQHSGSLTDRRERAMACPVQPVRPRAMACPVLSRLGVQPFRPRAVPGTSAKKTKDFSR